ncbi:NAD(+) synthase [Clostridiales bacterium COT073_COT-073]|nr:NAD(+) synthase [Clostridiales bacterium COT073_COT-073]
MKSLHQYGYYKIAAAVPVIKVADVTHNTKEILKLIEMAATENISLLAFPELCLCGASCGDLFWQTALQKTCKQAIMTIAKKTKDLTFPIIIGSPMLHQNRLYNCAVILIKGQVKGLVAKNSLTTEESKYFTSALSAEWDLLDFGQDESAYFDNSLSFYHEDCSFSFTIELGEDYYLPLSPSAINPYLDTQIIVNPCALPATVSSRQKKELRLQELSAKSQSIYLHINAGYGESSTDKIYDGSSCIFENGQLIASNLPFQRENQLLTGIVDLERIATVKSRTNLLKPSDAAIQKVLGSRHCIWYSDKNDHLTEDVINPNSAGQTDKATAAVPSRLEYSPLSPLLPTLAKFPFIPEDAIQLEQNCQEIAEIISSGLIKRLTHIHAKTSVIGISGGLDSTLALLLVALAYQKMGKNLKEIIGVRMPGFGTSGGTYQNSLTLMRLMGISEREVDIKASVIQHLKDIEHPLEQHDTTYENAQARERTQILMDIANQTGGLVIGTGDLSELALGFCTYNGDHMSMYSVNASIPKTLIPYVIRSLGRKYSDPELIAVLQKIIDTPISPELLPPTANQKILQKTEELIGPYALHDFFLYYMLRYGFAPGKIRALAVQAFAGDFSYEEVDKWIKLFYRRFFTHQFKRNCLPDSPLLGSISLFSTFHMPSDALVTLWLSDLENETDYE